MEIEILQRALESCLLAGRNTYPDEFIGLLRGEEGRENAKVRVTGLLMAPLAEYAPEHSSYSELHLPVGLGVVGTVHSHPNGYLSPSRQDLRLFARGRVHAIVGPPFTAGRGVEFFDSNGRATSWWVAKE